MRYILLSGLLLTGCDSVVKSEKLGEPRISEQTVSCHHASYCYTCMPGFDGGMKCGLKFSSMCSGNQRAIVEKQEVRYYYESGKVRVSDTVNIVKELEACH